jgi:2-iminobutanoate/2-iminopropanoate deaminase
VLCASFASPGAVRSPPREAGVDDALVAGGVEAETLQVLTNLTEVLAAGGASWTDVVKTTIYLTNLADFATVNRLYGDRVGAVPPARATVQVAALPKGAAVEIEAIAHVPAARS